MDTPVKVDRRQFLGTSAGFSVGLFLSAGASSTEAAVAATQINSWLNVGADNTISLTIGASEMGQGSFSGLGQILAEDLMVDFGRVTLLQGGPIYKVSPAPIGSAIVTAGSSVTRSNYWRLRDAAASTRETLVLAAMNRLKDTNRSNFSVVNGVINHVSGASLTYGDVASDASLLVPVANAPLVPDGHFKVIGQALARPDIPLKVDGSAKFGIDIRLPNMVFAVVRHCPSFGGTVASVPATPSGSLAVVALKVSPGTGRGTEVDGAVNAIAVVAATTWDAMQAARSANVKWLIPASSVKLNNAQFLADGQSLLTSAPAFVAGGTNPPGTCYTVESAGDANGTLAGLPAGTKLVDATYTLPYASHGCMEVLNCTVDYVPGVSCTVYAPTQVANSALALVVALTGLAANQIVFHTTFLGGGLGRKAEIDFIGQAVQVAMAIKRPVQLVWPREEDFGHDQYRPMAVVRARAGVGSTGQIAAWSYRNVSPSIQGQRGRVLGATGDNQGWEGSAALPYTMGSRLVEWVSHPSPIPVGYWRSVGASINTFAVESMVDELAAAAGLDPYRFRKSLISDPRWSAVLDAVASLGGWSSPTTAGTARGLAIGAAFNSIVATVVEIRGTSATSFTVTKVAVVLDSYLTVNPGSVDAQLVGGVVHGLNAALYGQQTFVNGAAQKRNFNVNRVTKLQEMPQVSVHLMPAPAVSDRTVPIGGVGELGVPTVAPALANAVFRLTGQRLRTLPLFPNATMGDG
jgi:isoquinoline 1-oxidoreductase beta subunit